MNQNLLIFSTILFCLSLPLLVHALKHDYKISGTLFYNNKPWTGHTVYLYDKDGLFNYDDRLGETKTDEEGKFVVAGSEDEEETPEPYIFLNWGYDVDVKVWLERETVEQTVIVHLWDEGIFLENKGNATVNGHEAKISIYLN